MGPTILRVISAYIIAVGVTVVAGSGFHTYKVLGALSARGVKISAETYMQTMISDLVGLAPQYGMVVAIALALGFIVAAIITRVVRPLAPIAYPIAGAAAIATALTLMSIMFDGITPIAGARGAVGFSLQCLAGAIGGVVFAMISVRRRN